MYDPFDLDRIIKYVSSWDDRINLSKLLPYFSFLFFFQWVHNFSNPGNFSGELVKSRESEEHNNVTGAVYAECRIANRYRRVATKADMYKRSTFPASAWHKPIAFLRHFKMLLLHANSYALYLCKHSVECRYRFIRNT